MSDRFKAFIEEVRAASDIVEVIGSDTALKRTGRTLTGRSPFNADEHPSFTVYPDSQSFYDFSGGGGIGGDVFTYVEKRDGVGFKEAVYTLAERAGIKRPDQNDESFRRELALLVERRDVEALLTQAAAYCHRILPSRIREEHYRNHYGFTDATIDALQLGWANGTLWLHFVDELKVPRDLALKTGLFVVTAGGKVEDFFCDRLVFPYWKQGRVVYFIARRTEYTGDEEWERSKYKKLLTHSDRHAYVSPTVRNEHFYNEDAVRGAEVILVTEGVTDCISALQAGMPTISPVTTRFRKEDAPKLLALTKHAKRVVICNDAEENQSGAKGALETAALLFAERRDVRIADLPRPEGAAKIDVNEYIKDHSPDEFRAVLDRGDRYLERLIKQVPADGDKLDLAARLRSILETVAQSPSIEQEAWLDLIAKRFSLTRKTLAVTLKEIRSGFGSKTDALTEKASADVVKGEIFEERDHYYVRGGEGLTLVISSFHIEPTLRVETEDGEMIVGDVTTTKGSVVKEAHFPKTAFSTKQSLIRALPNSDMTWTGSDDNAQGLLRLLSNRDVPRKRGTSVMGWLETPEGPRFVLPDAVLATGGRIEEGGILYLPNGSTFPERIHLPRSDNGDGVETARRILPELLRLNEPRVVLPVLGWFFASPLKPLLMRLLRHFPILMVWGTAGSGKTTLVKEVFWPLFGIDPARNEPFSVTETEFTLIKLFSSTNAVPVFLDEYRPSDMPFQRLNTLHRYLRRLYGGEVEERGRKDLTVQAYRLSAPVCMAGEARPDDAALADRMVAVCPNRNTLTEQPECALAFQRLKRIRLGLFAEPYLRFCLARDVEADLARARTVAESVLGNIPEKDDASLRCRDNLLAVTLGLLLFEEFAQSLGVRDLPDLDIEAAFSGVVGDLMDGDRGAKNPLDHFIEGCSVMAYNGQLLENRHYAYVEGKLCLHLQSCWPLYLEHKKKTGQAVEANGLRALKRLVKENHQRGGYVVEIDKRVHLNDSFPRTLALDLEQAKTRLDIEDFPMNANRTWGGFKRTERYDEN